MTPEEKLTRLKEILEEYDSIFFSVYEQGLGEAEVDSWKGRLYHEAGKILNARRTCTVCGVLHSWDSDGECEQCLYDLAHAEMPKSSPSTPPKAA